MPTDLRRERAKKKKKERKEGTRQRVMGNALKKLLQSALESLLSDPRQGNESFVNNFPLERLVGALITL